MHRQFQPTEGRVVSEVIDGEAIILDLTTGSYFSADHVGAAVWSLLGAGTSVETVVSFLAGRFALDPDAVAGDVAAFVRDLDERGLLQPLGRPGDEASALASVSLSGGPYQAPRLAVYEDMQDLLFIDPIHDVGEAGWPLRKDAKP